MSDLAAKPKRNTKPQRQLAQAGAGSVADRDRRLHTVFEVAKVLATERDPELTLPKILSSLIETFSAADAGLLFLYDPSDGYLRVAAAQGYVLAAMQRLCLSRGESMSGKVFESGQAALYATPRAVSEAMDNLSPENRELFQAATSGLAQPLSTVCVPLNAHDAKVGTLVLHNLRQARSFTTSDLDFLQHVSDLIALSIEKAHLREELEEVRAFSEANRLKAELISTLAHEMRTPLTSIKGYSTALLMEDAAFSPATQAEFLTIIDEECDVLQDLIHDLLESSIIDAGLLKLETQPVLIPRLVNGILTDMVHRNKEHRFVVDFPSAFPIVDADPQRIAQVLRNLLDNAFKYSPEGGLVVVRGEALLDEVVISVADQGEGIAPEHLNRLFEKFFRIKSGLGRHVVGSGLGLPISRAIVESHGGRIWAESLEGQGSTFYFTLPLKGPSEEHAEPEVVLYA
jgi:signal transduction histidine kinase